MAVIVFSSLGVCGGESEVHRSIQLSSGASVAGDFTGDLAADFRDVMLLQRAWGQTDLDAGYSPEADLVKDGSIDSADLTRLAHILRYGDQTLPTFVGAEPPHLTGVQQLLEVIFVLNDNDRVDEAATEIAVMKNGAPFTNFARDHSRPNQITVTIQESGDGVFDFLVTPHDFIGNTGYTSLTRVVSDKTPPSVVGSTPAHNTWVQTLASITFHLADNIDVDEARTAITALKDGREFTAYVRDDSRADQVTLILSDVSDGVFDFTVVAQDTAGNQSQPVVVRVGDDSAAPVLFSSSPANGAYAKSIARFDLALRDNIDVDEQATGISVSRDGLPLVLGQGYTRSTTGREGEIRVTLTAPQDGVYHVQVLPVDAAGNVGALTTLTATQDNTPPSVAAFQPPDGAAVGALGQVDITLADNYKVNELATRVSITRDGVLFSGWNLVKIAENKARVNIPAPADGVYQLIVKAVDAAGNESAPVTAKLIDDSVGPVLVSALPADGARVARLDRLALRFDDTAGLDGEATSVAVTYDNNTNDNVAPVLLLDVARDTSQPNVLILELNDPQDGEYVFTVVPKDKVGNVGAPFTITIHNDNTGPVVESVTFHDDTATPPRVTTGNAIQTLNRVVIDFHDNLDMDEAGTLISVLKNNAAYTAFARDDTQANRITITLNEVSDGAYLFVVTPRDAAGNVGAAYVAAITDDSQPPALVACEPAEGARLSALTEIVLAYHDNVAVDEAGCEVEITRNGAELAPGADFTRDNGVANQVRFAIHHALDGVYAVTTVPRDTAGNVGEAVTVTFYLDRQAPFLIASAPVNFAAVQTLSAIHLIFGDNVDVDEAGSLISLARDGQTLAQGADYTRFHGTANQIRVDIANPQDGEYTLTLVPRDMGGNQGAPMTLTFFDDSVAPNVAGADLPNNAVVNSPPTISFTLNDDVGIDGEATLVTVTRNGQTLTPGGGFEVQTGAENRVGVNLLDAADGVYAITVIAVDRAGNQSAPYTLTVIVDATAPETLGPITGSLDCVGDLVTLTVLFHDDGGLDGAATQVSVIRDKSTLVEGADYVVETGVANQLTIAILDPRDGDYLFMITPVDRAGNTGESRLISMVDDSTPPTVVGTTPADGDAVQSLAAVVIALDDNIDVNEAATQLTVRRDNVLLLEGVDYTRDNGVPGQVTITLSAPTDGRYELTITPVDGCANSGATVVGTILADATLPGVTGVYPPAGACVPTVNMIGIALSDDGGVDAAGTIIDVTRGSTLLVEGVDYARLNGVDTVSLALSSPRNARYEVTITPRDTAGNVGAATTAVIYDDNGAPTVTGAVPASGSVATILGDIVINMSDDVQLIPAASIVTVRRDDETLIAGHDYMVDTLPSGIVVRLANPAIQGNYTVTARPVDHCGNVGAATTLNYAVDRAGPVVVGSAPANNACVPTLGIITVLLSDATNVNEAATDVALTRNGAPLLRGFEYSVNTGTDNQVTVNVHVPHDGVYQLTVTPRDFVGNLGDSVVLTFIDDNTAPSVLGTTPANQAAVGSLSQVEIALYDAVSVNLAATSVVAALDDALLTAGEDYTLAASGETTLLFSPLRPFIGALTLWVTPIDHCGNTGALTEIVIHVDTTAPSVTTVDPPEGCLAALPQIVVGLSDDFGVDEQATVVELRRNNALLVEGGDYTVDRGGDNQLTIAFADPQPARYDLMVTPADTAGNQGSMYSAIYYADASAPEVLAATPAHGSTVASLPLMTIALRDDVLLVESSTILAATRDGLPLVANTDFAVDASVPGQIQIVFTDVVDGDYSVAVAPVDHCGHVADAVMIDVTADSSMN